MPASLLCFALTATGPLFAGSFNGTVRSTANAVLQGMVATAYDAGGNVAASATTDANGKYLMSLSAGQYRVLVYDPNGAWATAFCNGAESFESSPVQSVSASTTTTIDFQLQRAGTVSGTVLVGAAAGSGITVAAYNLSGTRRGFTTTTTQGTYNIVLPPGQFKLAAYDDAGLLTPLFYSGKTSFADAIAINVVSLSNVGADFNLDYAAYLAGTVADRASQLPLAAMIVYAYTPAGGRVASTTTGANGNFSIKAPAGSYRLVAADPRAVYASAFFGDAVTFGKSSIITVSAGQTRGFLTMAMDRGGLISGRVADGNSVSIGGIHVAAYNDDGTPRTDLTTDNTGTYLLVLPPGVFRLAAFDDRLVFATEFYDRKNELSSATPVSIAAGQIVPAADFVLTRAGQVAGVVTDAATGGPLANITVAAYDSSSRLIASAASGSSGQYTVAVPPGEYRVVAWDAGHRFANSFDGGAANLEATAPRTLASGTSQFANFAMSLGTQISGKVVTGLQTPIGGIEIDALDMQGNHVASAISEDDGSFIIAVLPNSYKLFACDPGLRYRSSYYNGAGNLHDAAVIAVSGSAAPAPVSITLALAQRHRAAGH